MTSVTCSTSKSSENLRVVIQPYDYSLQSAKSLRLPSQPSLITPPPSPFPCRPGYSESSANGRHTGRTSSSTKQIKQFPPQPLLSPTAWPTNLTEPVKSSQVPGPSYLSTPPPSPHKVEDNPPFKTHFQLAPWPTSPPLNVTTRNKQPRLRLLTPFVDGSHESPINGVSEMETLIQASQPDVLPPRGNVTDSTSCHHMHKNNLPTPDVTQASGCPTPLSPDTPSQGLTPSTEPVPVIHPISFDKTCKQTTTHRLPGVLRHQVASETARRSVKGTNRTADRYVPGRDLHTRARDKFLSTTPPDNLSYIERKYRKGSPAINPFSCGTRPGTQIPRTRVEARGCNGQHMSISPTRLRINTRNTSPIRGTSLGTIWNVGGSAVAIDGVLSTSDGHGGRIASGTNAPMYTSAFLDHTKPSECLEMHERRLAAALGFDQANRILVDSTDAQGSAISPVSSNDPSSPTLSTSSPTFWRDNHWSGNEGTSLLDAPALRDDYYCSLLAYSRIAKCLAVGLGAQVYLWSETRGVRTPDSLTSPFAGHVTSLSFSSSEGGNAILAIGRADGRITLWSPFDKDPRFDSDQPAPVSSVCFSPKPSKRASIRDPSIKAWTEHLLIGDEAGHVYFYSIEWPNLSERDLYNWHGSMTLLARVTVHSQQICGLAWSPDGDYFATGGNDNSLFMFETRKVLRPAADQEVSSVQVRSGGSAAAQPLPGQGSVISVVMGQESQHWQLNAAVKAVAFCPWQPSLLAAGGGSNDRCIHFYHALSGASLAIIDCAAQVTSLVWSKTRREIAATFGFAQPDHAFRVAVFSWPGCETLVKIPWWGEERALWAVAYPGGPNMDADDLGAGSEDGGEDGTRRPSSMARRAREGTAWYARRTRDEGCLVIATSDASIKFHEVWSEGGLSRAAAAVAGGLGLGMGGSLGGSDILEALHGVEKDGRETIR